MINHFRYNNILLKYEYGGVDTYQPKEVNLGDYIQSLAALQFYPNEAYSLIDRDQLSLLCGGYRGILNGWYHLSDQHHILSKDNDLLLTAMHINNIASFPSFQKVLDSWKKYGPIGCRDMTTMNFLQKQGYQAYFSGCLTTTLGYKYLSKESRSGILLLDSGFYYPQIKFFPLNKFLKEGKFVFKMWKIFDRLRHLSRYKNERIILQSNIASLKLTQTRRFEKARELLNAYMRAKLVITSRIHCALPCLALGTPVILCVPKYDELRYPGLDKFLNTVFIKNNQVDSNIQLKNGKVINPDTYKPYARKLIRQCRDFMKE